MLPKPEFKLLAAERAKLAGALSPCPFCGSRDLYLGYLHSAAMGVQCQACWATGPPADYPDVYDVPKRFCVGNRVPAKNYWPSVEALDVKLLRRAFRAWQKRAKT